MDPSVSAVGESQSSAPLSPLFGSPAFQRTVDKYIPPDLQPLAVALAIGAGMGVAAVLTAGLFRQIHWWRSASDLMRQDVREAEVVATRALASGLRLLPAPAAAIKAVTVPADLVVARVTGPLRPIDALVRVSAAKPALIGQPYKNGWLEIEPDRAMLLSRIFRVMERHGLNNWGVLTESTQLRAVLLRLVPVADSAAEAAEHVYHTLSQIEARGGSSLLWPGVRIQRFRDLEHRLLSLACHPEKMETAAAGRSPLAFLMEPLQGMLPAA